MAKGRGKAVQYETLFIAVGFDRDGDVIYDGGEDKDSVVNGLRENGSGIVTVKAVVEINIPKSEPTPVPTKTVTL